MTSAGVTKAAAGTPAIRPAVKSVIGLLYLVKKGQNKY
jgi:hypothetical protein